MKITYDPEVDAAYIYLVDIPAGGVDSTVSLEGEGLESFILDFDDNRRLLGIEILGASKRLPSEVIKNAIKI